MIIKRKHKIKIYLEVFFFESVLHTQKSEQNVCLYNNTKKISQRFLALSHLNKTFMFLFRLERKREKSGACWILFSCGWSLIDSLRTFQVREENVFEHQVVEFQENSLDELIEVFVKAVQ